MTVLLEGMPKVCKLPLFDYKASGCLAFYHLRLIEVIGHKELQTSVFHSFRELGNAIVFIMLLEESMVCRATSMPPAHRCGRRARRPSTLSSPCPSTASSRPPSKVCEHRAVIRSIIVAEGENAEEMARQAAERMSFMNFERVFVTCADPEVPAPLASASTHERQFKNLGRQANIFTRERVCRGLCILESVLQRIKVRCASVDRTGIQCAQGYLDEASVETTAWKGPPPSNGIVDVDECLLVPAAARIYSAAQATASTGSGAPCNSSRATRAHRPAGATRPRVSMPAPRRRPSGADISLGTDCTGPAPRWWPALASAACSCARHPSHCTTHWQIRDAGLLVPHS